MVITFTDFWTLENIQSLFMTVKPLTIIENITECLYIKGNDKQI